MDYLTNRFVSREETLTIYEKMPIEDKWILYRESEFKGSFTQFSINTSAIQTALNKR